MAHIFVSYAHVNKDRVSALADGLRGSGFSLWWDDDLRAGQDFTLEIERELDGAKCVVVAWPEAAREAAARAGLKPNRRLASPQSRARLLSSRRC